jgi:TatD DNase family protein
LNPVTNAHVEIINELLKEKDISPDSILTTYYCSSCRDFEIKKFTHHKENCRFCGGEKTQETSNVKNGVSEVQLNHIYNLMEYDSMVAIGEIGLDYFRNISDPEIQKEIFVSQMKIAQDLDKPVIIHNRNSDQDMIKILREFPNVRGIAHCFSSDIDMAKAFLDIGYYISFSGNLTFKNSHLPEVAKEIPLDRILVETDSPYLSPEPYRGKSNEPGRTRFVAEKLADIFNLSFKEIAKQTDENSSEIFQIP